MPSERDMDPSSQDRIWRSGRLKTPISCISHNMRAQLDRSSVHRRVNADGDWRCGSRHRSAPTSRMVKVRERLQVFIVCGAPIIDITLTSRHRSREETVDRIQSRRRSKSEWPTAYSHTSHETRLRSRMKFWSRDLPDQDSWTIIWIRDHLHDFRFFFFPTQPSHSSFLTCPGSFSKFVLPSR